MKSFLRLIYNHRLRPMSSYANPRKGLALVLTFDAKKIICVCGFANKIRTLNMGLADHACRADPLVCAHATKREFNASSIY